MSEFTNGGLKLSADIPASVAQLNSDIARIQSKLNNIEVTAKLNDSSIKDLENKLTKVSSNINLSVNGQHLQSQISHELDASIKKVSSKGVNIPFKINFPASMEFRKQLEGFVSELTNAEGEITRFTAKTRTVFDEGSNKNIENVVGGLVTYKNALGEVITKTLSYEKIGEYTNPVTQLTESIKGFREVSSSYTKNIEQMEQKTKSFSDKVSKEQSTLTNRLNEIYNKATDVNSAKPITNSDNLNVLQSQYKTTITSIEALKSANSDTFAQMQIEVNNNISVLKQLITQISNAENIASKLKAKPFDVVKDIEDNNLNTFITKVENSIVPIDKMRDDLKLLKDSMSNVTDAEGLISYTNQLSIVESKFKSLLATENTKLTFSDTNSDLAIMQSKLDSLKLSYNQLINPNKELTRSVESLASEYTRINSLSDGNEKVKEYQKLNNLYRETSTKLEVQLRSQKMINSMSNQQVSLESRKKQILASHSAYYEKHTKLTRSTKEEAVKLVAEMKKVDEAIRNATDNSGLTNLNRKFSELNSTVKELHLNGISFGDKLKREAVNIASYFSVGSAIFSVVNAFKGGLSTLKEVDTYMTEISKTSNMTANQLSDYASNAFSVASKYGTTVENFLSATEEMARSGFTGDDLQNLAELTILTETAGDVTREIAEAYILATNASYEFGGNAEKLGAVLDSQNYITNRNSVSLEDMAVAMTKTGSIAGQTGVAIDELSALIGTAVSRTKKSGDEVGTSIKSLLINLQNINSSKISGTFDKAGISMTKYIDGMNQLKTPIELLKELSNVYTNTDDSIMKSEILTNIGGKYHANVLSSLLTGMEDYEKMISEYSQGEGSALVEMEKTRSSWEGVLNSIKNTWTDFVSGFATDNSITGLLNIVDGLSTGFVSLSKSIGSVPTLIGLTTGLITLAKVDMSPLIKGFQSANASIKTYNTNLNSSTQKQDLFLAELTKTNPNLATYLQNLNGSKTSLVSYGAELVATKAKMIGLTVVASTLSAVLSAGLTLGISALINLFTGWKTKQDELNESIKESASVAVESSNTLVDLASKYDLATRALENHTGTKEAFATAQQDLIEGLELEQTELDRLCQKYGDLDKAIKGATLEKLKENQGDLTEGVTVAEKELMKTGSDGLLNDKLDIKIDLPEEDIDRFKDKLKDVEDISFYLFTGFSKTQQKFSLLGDDESVDGILQNYDALLKVRTALEEIYSKTELTHNDFYGQINSMIKEYKNAVDNYNSAISNVNKNQAQQDIIGKMLGNDIPKTQEEFNSLKQSIIDTVKESKNYIGSVEDRTNAVINQLASMPEFSKFFNDVSDSAGKSADELSGLDDELLETSEDALTKLSSLSDVLEDSDISKSVSSFTTGIKTINSSLSSLYDIAGNSTELANLMTSFPDFDWAKYNLNDTNELKKALKDLANNELKKVLEILGQYDSTNGLSQQFKDMVDNIINAKGEIKSLEDSMSTLSTNAKLLNSVNEEVDGGGRLHLATLNDIQKAYPQLEQAIMDYNQGLIDEKELFLQLEGAYKTDENNYKLALIEKNKANTDFYNKILNNNIPDWLTDLADSYDIDLKNYDTLCEAKLELEKQLVTKTAKMRSAGQMAVLSQNDPNLPDGDFQQKYKDAQKEYSDIIKIIDGIDTSVETSLNLDTSWQSVGSGSSSKSGKSGSGDKDTSVKVDYLKQSINELTEAYNDAKIATDNLEKNGSSDYYTDKKEAIENENKALKDLIGTESKYNSKTKKTTKGTGYQGAKEYWEDEYEKALKTTGDSEKYRKLIESGKKIDITKYGKEKGTAINNAIEAKNNIVDYDNKIQESEQQQVDNNRRINESELEQLGILLEISKLNEESATNITGKNTAIDDQIELLKQQSTLEQANAKSEEESNKIKLDFEQQIATLRQNKHQNKADDYQSQYDSLENQKAKAQNYSDKNAIINKQLKLLKKVYNQEIQTVTTEEEKAKLLEEYNANVDTLTKSKLANQVEAQEKLANLQQNELSNLEKQIELKNQLSDTNNTSEDYDQLISKAKQVQLVYQNLYETKKKEMQLAIKSGEYKEYDDKWYEGYETLGSYKSAIDDCTQSIISYNKEAEKVTFDNFEKGIDKLGNLASELSDLRDMINDDNLVDSSGNITVDGNSAILLDGKMIANNKAQIQSYVTMISELNRKYESGAIDLQYYNSKLNEYQSAQRALAKENISLQKDITDIKIESINAITDAYEKQVELMTKEIDKAEELRKKQKETEKDNLEIAKLKDKIAKLSASDNAKDQATARELQNTLNEKMAEQEEQQLEDTAKAKKDALDDSLDKLKKTNEEEIKSIKDSYDKQELIANEMLNTVQSDYLNTMTNIMTIVSENSVSIGESLNSPWVSGQNAIQAYIDLAQKASQVNVGYGGVSSPTTADKIKSILSQGSGTGKGSSDLNQAIISQYGSQISYEQMAQIAELLSLGDNLTGKDMIGNDDLKNNILAMLRSLGLISSVPHFASGGIVEKYKGKDDGLAFLKAGEGVLNLKEMATINNLKPVIPSLNNLTDVLKNVDFKGVGGKQIVVEGNLIDLQLKDCVTSESLLKEMKGMVYTEAESALNKVLRKYN